ncbi:MAG: pyridoxal-phosphate dependent enzyme, partial [Bacteroidota bacterium]
MIHPIPTIYQETPVWHSSALDKRLQRFVGFKMDCFQPSRSFKLRGMAHLCRTHAAQGQRSFIASSGGNAGYSLAYAGQVLGVNVKVIVPETTPRLMVDRIRSLGAQVQVHGAAWDEADALARAEAEEQGAVYVSPFDDALLWEGHATMMDECARQMRKPDLIVVAVGGGGLLCGVLQGMARNDWGDVKVLTAETEGAASFAAALEAGEVVTLPAITSVASSLGAKAVSKTVLAKAKQFNVASYVCSDEDTFRGIKAFSDDFNV